MSAKCWGCTKVGAPIHLPSEMSLCDLHWNRWAAHYLGTENVSPCLTRLIGAKA